MRPDRFVVQYLEPGPETANLDVREAARTLAYAFERWPISDICLGWNLPATLLESVAEAAASRARIWLWYPVLTAPGALGVRNRALGASGSPPHAFRRMDEFRFACPNNPETLASVRNRLASSNSTFAFDGVMLDRIRWPSPTNKPVADIACFCPECFRSANAVAIDLERVRSRLYDLEATLDGRRAWLRAVLGTDDDAAELTPFLAWRRASITKFVEAIAVDVARRGTALAIDAYAPSLANSVGQDLRALAKSAEWVKAMVYLDTRGPAGLPYELRGYARWLAMAGERDPFSLLRTIAGLEIRQSGSVPVRALTVEIGRLADLTGQKGVVGTDVVEVAGIAHIDEDATFARTAAIRASGLGYSPSWDLARISPKRVETISAAWLETRPH